LVSIPASHDERWLNKIGDYIKVTCSTDTLIHYYVVHSGDPIIHMATYTTAG
jgi:hypothetical protein